jgi:ornithine cyclodeaminase/alanine dehydrogenase-like protein (mu-crystallin family)
MRVLSESQIRAVAAYDVLVPAVEQSFAALSSGDAQLPAVMSFEFPDADGEAHVKGAHLRGSPYYVVKVASGFYQNPSKGLPVGAGLVLAFGADSGRPEALLLDNGLLTDMRTGAAGAVAARYLARRELAKVAVIGAGIQARCQLRALRCVRVLPPISLWSRSHDRAEQMASEMGAELGTEFHVAATTEDAVTGADLVITVTPSRAPVVRGEWLSPGAHVTAIGSDMPEKRELDAGVFRRADVVVADRIAQCIQTGELHHALADRAITPDDIAGELGDVVLGKVAGRSGDDQITVCDLTGVGVQDAAAASVVLQAAAAANLGTELPL